MQLIGWLIAFLFLFPFCHLSRKKKPPNKATTPTFVSPSHSFLPITFSLSPFQVNNHRTRLPVSLAQGKLHLQQKGSFVQIKTDFMLKVLYNWDGHLMVKMPSSQSGKVCGLCGNSNGDPQDDALLPDGTLAQNAVVLGQVWKVLGDHRICSDSCSGECKRCSWKETAKYNTEAFCGLLTQHPGPFQGCHDAVHTDIYLKSCISDLCSYEGLHTVLCQALNAYVENCQEEGIVVGDWRTPARCCEWEKTPLVLGGRLEPREV